MSALSEGGVFAVVVQALPENPNGTGVFPRPPDLKRRRDLPRTSSSRSARSRDDHCTPDSALFVPDSDSLPPQRPQRDGHRACRVTVAGNSGPQVTDWPRPARLARDFRSKSIVIRVHSCPFVVQAGFLTGPVFSSVLPPVAASVPELPAFPGACGESPPRQLGAKRKSGLL